MELSRRQALRVLGAAGLLAAVPACASPFVDARLTVATGGTQGVYYALGTALAAAWQERLGLAAAPAVLPTAGSLANLSLLASGGADVVFSQVDTVADRLGAIAAKDPRAPRALARIYDDVVHVVVRESSPFLALPDLRGARVSVGARDSGVSFIARRLLAVAGLSPDADLQAAQLGINESVAAMRAGEIDAFFWSGGLPTAGVSELASSVPIRLLDLGDLVGAVRERFPGYASGTVPAMSYGIREPVTTLLVRNVLLVPAAMPDDLAAALVDALFDAQEELAQASVTALTIDPRSAIGTQPVALHPGAQRFYRAEKIS
jgi:uncharacterized protein